MQDTNNDAPDSESQPAASVTPPPVSVAPTSRDIWKESKAEFAKMSKDVEHGLEKLNEDEKKGCGCLVLILCVICFLLGRCSCSDTSQAMPSHETKSVSRPVTGSNNANGEGEFSKPAERTPAGESAANNWTNENVRAALKKMDSTLPLFAGGTQSLFDVVEQLRYNEIDTEKLKSEIVLEKDDGQGTWMVDNVVNDAVIYSYRLNATVHWDRGRVIRIAVLREDGRYYAEDTDLPAGKFLFIGITTFTTVAGIETQIPAFRQVK